MIILSRKFRVAGRENKWFSKDKTCTPFYLHLIRSGKHCLNNLINFSAHLGESYASLHLYTTEIKCYFSFYIICVGSAFYFFSPYIYILECTCNRIAKWDSAGHVYILSGGERLQQISRRQPHTQTKKGNLSFSGKKGKENNIRSPYLNQKTEVLFVCLLACMFILFHFVFIMMLRGNQVWGDLGV